MTPDQCLVVLKNKGFTGKTTLKEKWYGTEYNEKTLDSKEQLQRWSACLRDETSSIHINDHEWKKLVYLPQKNPFVPTDFAIRCETSSVSSENSEVPVPTLLEKIITSVVELDEEKEVRKKDGEVAVVAGSLENLQVENDDEEEEEEEEEEERTGVMPPPPGKVLTSWFLQGNANTPINHMIIRSYRINIL